LLVTRHKIRLQLVNFLSYPVNRQLTAEVKTTITNLTLAEVVMLKLNLRYIKILN